MANLKYLVDLSEEKEQQLRKFISRGKVSARRAARAWILLKASDGLSDEQVAVALEVGSGTVGRIRQRFAEEGLEAALKDTITSRNALRDWSTLSAATSSTLTSTSIGRACLPKPSPTPRAASAGAIPTNYKLMMTPYEKLK